MAADLGPLLVHAATMLAVDDFAASLAFYTERLGFEVLHLADEATHQIALLELGGLRLYLIPHSPPTDDKPGVTLTPPRTAGATPVAVILEVDDAVAAHRALVAAGVEFLTPPQRPPWGGLRCFALDPSGYLIEVEQERDPPGQGARMSSASAR